MAHEVTSVCMFPECRAHLGGPVDGPNVSHGICPTCVERMLAELDAEPAPTLGQELTQAQARFAADTDYAGYLAGTVPDPRD